MLYPSVLRFIRAAILERLSIVVEGKCCNDHKAIRS